MDQLMVLSGTFKCGNPDCPVPEGHDVLVTANPMEFSMLAEMWDLADSVKEQIADFTENGTTMLLTNSLGTVLSARLATPGMALIASMLGGMGRE